MRVAIIGGKLQGVEAAYLARKAGWQTLLIDRNANPPASGLCDETIQADICTEGAVEHQLNQVDLIIPALEDLEALAALRKLEKGLACPVAFDFAANAISCSKSRSHSLFNELGLTLPRPYPLCGFPMLVKPDGASGSKGVTILADEAECELFFGKNGVADGWVGQQFVSGPSYSVEVIGRGGRYVTPQITEIHVDEGYDCKAVTAPVQIGETLCGELRRVAVQLAEALDLSGIMDVEVIVQDDRLYLLEIDARLPSQTPIAVFWSRGANMLEMLAQSFLPEMKCPSGRLREEPWVRLEHIRVEAGVLTLAGEHLMGSCGPLHVREKFFGVREAVTDFQPGKDSWCATLIHTGATFADLQASRLVALAAIKAGCGIERVVDSEPAVNPYLIVPESVMS